MLHIHNLTIARGNDALLLQNLSLSVAAGTTLVLKGANGSGKTSFLRAIAGLLTPLAGHIDKPDFLWLAAQPIIPSLETPRDYLAFHELLTVTPAKAGVWPDARLRGHDNFGILNLIDTTFNKLSTGQRQRVKLSRLLVAHQPLWLLDEPSDGLDAEGVKTLQYIITQHTKNGGVAVIATHQPTLWPQAETLQFGGAHA
jgi:heme exporter protein A